MTDCDLVERVARAWATIDRNEENFDEGYIKDAKALLEISGVADEITRLRAERDAIRAAALREAAKVAKDKWAAAVVVQPDDAGMIRADEFFAAVKSFRARLSDAILAVIDRMEEE